MTGHLKVLSLGVALLALLAVGSVSGRGVFAQDSTATPSATSDDGTSTDGSNDKTDKDDESDRDGQSNGGGRSDRDGGMNKEGFRGGGGFHIDSEALATFLGITTDELKTELRAGGSLASVAEAHGKTREELKSFLIEQYTAGLDAIIDATPGSKSNGDAGDDSTATPEIEASPAASAGLLS